MVFHPYFTGKGLRQGWKLVGKPLPVVNERNICIMYPLVYVECSLKQNQSTYLFISFSSLIKGIKGKWSIPKATFSNAIWTDPQIQNFNLANLTTLKTNISQSQTSSKKSNNKKQYGWGVAFILITYNSRLIQSCFTFIRPKCNPPETRVPRKLIQCNRQPTCHHERWVTDAFAIFSDSDQANCNSEKLIPIESNGGKASKVICYCFSELEELGADQAVVSDAHFKIEMRPLNTWMHHLPF